jgi:hypothetical protein
MCKLRVYIHKYPCTSNCVSQYVKERKNAAIIRKKKGDHRRQGKFENQAIAVMPVSILI